MPNCGVPDGRIGCTHCLRIGIVVDLVRIWLCDSYFAQKDHGQCDTENT